MNLLVWSAQALVVVIVAAGIAQLIRTVLPSLRLAFWQVTLLASLLLPLIRPWQQEAVTAIRLTQLRITQVASPGLTQQPSAFHPLSTVELFLLIVAIGAIAKLTLLIAGLFKLRQYRREARPFAADPSWSTEATLLASESVTSPVTFGFLKPVILVPDRFADLAPELRDPILFHEILHVRRRDWLCAIVEETLRSLLWFHPGIWYAIREIQLAREETVDREVVNTMNARESYVDALLAIASSIRGPEMATAPFFIRRSHLKRRVISIFREAKMSHISKARSVSTLIAGCAAMALSCWYITGALPLKAQPQEVIDGIGITVDVNGARLMHRSPIMYPNEAVEKRVQGTVTAQVKLDASGNVSDASIVSGPEELRKAVLQSVLAWHFASDSANGTRQVAVTFAMGANAPTMVRTMPAPVINMNEPQVRITSISAPPELLSRLPVHEGDIMTPQLRADLNKVVKAYDEHLTVGSMYSQDSLKLFINAPGTRPAMTPPPPPPPPPTGMAVPSSITSTPGAIRVGGNVQNNNLINQVPPEYPPLAKMARVQGTVKFEATIGKDGSITNLHVVSGPPLLIQAAMQAVQQWMYKPTLLNGQPVDVITTIDINFTLPPTN